MRNRVDRSYPTAEDDRDPDWSPALYVAYSIVVRRLAFGAAMVVIVCS